MSPGNWTRVFWENSQHSYPLNQLSSLTTHITAYKQNTQESSMLKSVSKYCPMCLLFRWGPRGRPGTFLPRNANYPGYPTNWRQRNGVTLRDTVPNTCAGNGNCGNAMIRVPPLLSLNPVHAWHWLKFSIIKMGQMPLKVIRKSCGMPRYKTRSIFPCRTINYENPREVQPRCHTITSLCGPPMQMSPWIVVQFVCKAIAFSRPFERPQ